MKRSMLINLFLSIGKILLGFIGLNSVLVADGISSFSDMITDIFAIIGVKMSRRRANKKYPFGFGKVEYVASLAVAVIILIMGSYVIFNLELVNKDEPKVYTLIFIIIAIIVKYLLVKYLFIMSKKTKSDIIRYSFLESKNDIYSSFIVLLTTVIAIFFNEIEYFKYVSFFGSIVIALLIYKTGLSILISNARELVSKSFNGDLNEEIKTIILKHDEVLEINNFYLFKYGTYYQLFADIILKKDVLLSVAHDLNETIEKELKEKKIRYIFLDMDSKSI